jgi:hypothetical protein
VVEWQIERIEMNPSSKATVAATRARDARTMGELVRMLEKLDALERSRAGGRRKTKVRDDSELKEALVRRLHQLSDAAGEDAVSGKPQRG